MIPRFPEDSLNNNCEFLPCLNRPALRCVSALWASLAAVRSKRFILRRNLDVYD